jgi:hypothetical protein
MSHLFHWLVRAKDGGLWYVLTLRRSSTSFTTFLPFARLPSDLVFRSICDQEPTWSCTL